MGLTVLKSRCRQGCLLLLKALGEKLLLAFSNPWRLPEFLGLWPLPYSTLTCASIVYSSLFPSKEHGRGAL